MNDLVNDIDLTNRPATLPPALVQIVGPTDNWILERLARVLARKLPYAEFVPWRPRSGTSAKLAYYVNYALYAESSGLIDVGFFTHLDEEFGFLQRAQQMQCCVCMARIYADWLRNRGLRDIVHIPMGFDSHQFRPSLVLGVFGKLDHPRKGRQLVDRLQTLPFVEILLTEGRQPERTLRELYQRVDYVLIPATTEGGPMCLLEGLAMGKPVIAPDGVGMVPEFADDRHILRYAAGNADSLVNLVTHCYHKKLQPASLVANRSWDSWAEHHHRLFTRLFHEQGFELPLPSSDFRFGMFADMDLSLVTDTRSLEASLDRASQYLYFSDRLGARSVLERVVMENQFVHRLLATL